MPYSGNGSGDKIKFQVTELVGSGLWVGVGQHRQTIVNKVSWWVTIGRTEV